MNVKNSISLTCFLLVLVCWITFFAVNYLSFATILAAPVFGLAGFAFSIAAVRSKEKKVLSWILFSLNSLVITVYLAGVIYMTFFWNPRFF